MRIIATTISIITVVFDKPASSPSCKYKCKTFPPKIQVLRHTADGISVVPIPFSGVGSGDGGGGFCSSKLILLS
jgi:hypothetical protein